MSAESVLYQTSSQNHCIDLLTKKILVETAGGGGGGAQKKQKVNIKSYYMQGQSTCSACLDL
jgi:hypothetical protein